MNQFKTFLLMTALTLLLIYAGNLIGGESGMIMAFIIACVMNFGSYWFSDKIVLALYGAKEVKEADAPQLYSIVRNLARRASLPMPKVYIIPKPYPNAFATGRNPNHSAVAVTQGIMNLLSTDELSGVIGHELAHIKNRDILISTIAATFAGAITMLANMAQWALIFGGRGNDEERGSAFATLAMIIIAPIAATLIQLAISRSREYMADKEGAKIHGNPRDLASALRRLHEGQPAHAEANPATAHMFIVNPLRGAGVLALFSTHPPVDERIKRLLEMR